MLDCTTDTYQTLYARWLENPGALLDWVNYDPKQYPRVLDVCGGTGAVACEAHLRGGQVTLLDLNPRCTDPFVESLSGRAEDLTNLAYGRTWDFLICRQALCYLDLDETARALFEVAAPGARFVCNAFVKPRWSIHQYVFQGRRYFEASGYLGKHVFHLQAMRGDHDVTVFRWYSAEEIQKAFAPYWVLEKFEKTDKSLKFCFRRKA